MFIGVLVFVFVFLGVSSVFICFSYVFIGFHKLFIGYSLFYKALQWFCEVFNPPGPNEIRGFGKSMVPWT